MRAPDGLLRRGSAGPRALLALALVLVTALSAACGSARVLRRLDLPPGTRLYVAVFVDETEEGRVGVPLANAVRLEVYRRDPARLSMSFEEGTWALDGTVLALEEREEDGRVSLVVRARARLLDKGGAVIARLGELESSSRYRVARKSAETEERRAAAIDSAVRELAREIVRRVERANDEPGMTATNAEGEGVEG